MASISSLGIGSGLDLTSLLAGLKTAEQAPLAAIQKQQASYTTKLTAYGQISSTLGTLQSAATALSKATLFEGMRATSTATDVLTAQALPTAVNGSYAVNVTQLAQVQSLAANGVLSTTSAIGGGTVTIDFGTIGGGTFDAATGKHTGASFTPGTAVATPITIAANSTLENIRDAFNASANSGVTASIVNDGSATPNRLVLTSTQTGKAASMKINVTGDPALSSLLAHNPAATQNLRQTAAAQNTELTVNGIAITSATNKVEGAVQDVTMTVSKTGAATLSVQKDTASVQSAVNDFVSAYNNLQTVSARLTAYDAAKQSGAALLGDSTLRSIHVGIRSALTTPQTDDGSGLTMLSQIGVSFDDKGNLALDPAKLTAAMGTKMTGLANLFSGGASGYGTAMAALVSSYTDTTGGVLTAASKGISKTLDSLAKQYTSTSERAEATVARYKTQFSQLDLMMSRMNQTSTYLTAQFEAMNAKK